MYLPPFCVCVCVCLCPLVDLIYYKVWSYSKVMCGKIIQTYVVIFEKHLSCREIVIQTLIDWLPSLNFFAFNLLVKKISAKKKKNHQNANFCTFKLCFLGFAHRHNELFFSYLWSLSINSQVQEHDEKERPHIVQ